MNETEEKRDEATEPEEPAWRIPEEAPAEKTPAEEAAQPGRPGEKAFHKKQGREEILSWLLTIVLAMLIAITLIRISSGSAECPDIRCSRRSRITDIVYISRAPYLFGDVQTENGHSVIF